MASCGPVDVGFRNNANASKFVLLVGGITQLAVPGSVVALMASQPKNPRPDNEAADVPPEVDHDILESVDSVQEAIDSLNKKASVEILKVEQKFNKLRKPHYEHRAELLAKIPNFWHTVFMNHSHLRKVITEEDQKVLAYLRAVEVQEFDDITSGYKINFYFDENDWFKNDCITKEYHVSEKGEPTATSTKIEWKPGMDLTEMTDNGREGQKRDYPHQSSFFCWFAFDRNAVGDVIGDYIKDELWPNPLQYYLNPEIDSDEEVEEDLLDEEDDEEEEEEDDEDGQELAYDEAGGEDAAKSS
uniref:Phosphatase 2a inhibitor i2pp2a n=2 Tax=Echinococcus granulosus TaxID=6210 RepID=A0A068WLN2_ECHGR|nr:phosphatase 2a inhibitor i2pp2a [Echinococcus granulosus]